MSTPTAAAPRVLLVEDNEYTIEIVAILLDDLSITDLVILQSYRDFRVWLATDPAALTLALIDLQLPDADADGYQVLADLRGHPQFARIPLIAFTAHILAHDIARLHAAGFTGCIEKPIPHQQFKTSIQRVLTGEREWFHVGHTSPSRPASPPVPPPHMAMITAQRATFCTTLPTQLQALWEHWQSIAHTPHVPGAAVTTLQRNLHPLVGHAAMLGFAELSQCVRRINTHLRQILADPSTWPQGRAAVTHDFQHLMQHVESLLHQEPQWEQ